MCNAPRVAMNVPRGEIGVNLETSDVGVFARPVGEVDQASCHDLVGRQRRALVGERQRNPPRRTEALPDLHDRHSRRDPPLLIGDSKDEGRIVVAFGKNPSPRWMMKRQRLGMAHDEVEPALVLERHDEQWGLDQPSRFRRRCHGRASSRG